MKSFLINEFDVPKGSTLDIRELRNKQANRANIIAEIRKLTDDPRIAMNDTILIYYAGHGATMPPPEGWPGYSPTPPTPEGWSKDVEIQCIVASDVVVSEKNRRHYVSGVVLDRTLSALLHDLADKHGSNIVRRTVDSSTFLVDSRLLSQTVILDCCHSGSGTRDSPQTVRSVDFRDPSGGRITVPSDYDREIWSEFIGRGGVVADEYRHAGLASHVLLAACGSKEVASDGYSFTSALLEYFKTASLRFLSYDVLIRTIDPNNRLSYVTEHLLKR